MQALKDLIYDCIVLPLLHDSSCTTFINNNYTLLTFSLVCAVVDAEAV